MDNLITNISKLSLEKGDILVVKVPYYPSQLEKTKKLLLENIPKDIKVLLISDNVDIGLLKNKTDEYQELFLNNSYH